MDLKEALYDASDGAPPSPLDVDAMITGQRRRDRLVRAGGIAGGTAAAVVATAFAVTMLPLRTGHSLQAGAPPSVPTPVSSAAGEQCSSTGPDLDSGTTRTTADTTFTRGVPPGTPAAAAARFAAALPDAVRRSLPPGTITDMHRPACSPGVRYRTDYPEYQFAVVLGDAAGSNLLWVRVSPEVKGSEGDKCPDPGRTDCTSETLPDGTVIAADTLVDPGRPLLAEHSVMVRGHGTVVTLEMSNRKPPTDPGKPVDLGPSRDSLMLTLQQAVELARTPGLTLYP